MKTTYDSEIDFLHVSQIVHPSCQLVPVEFDPSVVAGNAVAVLLAQEDVLQTRRSLDTAAAVVLAQPDEAQVLFEDGDVGIGQALGNKEGVGLLEDAGGQNGVQEGVVFRLFFGRDDFGHFAVLVVIVEKGQ